MTSNNQNYAEAQNHRVGQNWSGGNRIPTIQKFAEHFDRDKRERDQRIDEENRAKKQHAKESGSGGGHKDGEVVAHQPREISHAKVRTVTDPTTGREIGVEDQDEKSMDAVKDPKVREKGTSLYRE